MVASPGFANQSSIRTAFRVAGVVLVVAGLALTVIAFLALFDTMSSDFAGGPPREFFLGFVGLPMLGVGGWCLQAGFGGVAARYAAGEAAPVMKDTASYLSDGEGVLGVGRTVDDRPSKFCSSCGRPCSGDARFCESCGHAVA